MRPSATESDWSREAPRGFWDPGRKLIGAVRDYQKGGRLRRRFAVLRHRFWSLATGAEVPLTTEIGGGLMLPHPNGVVVHPKSVIGPNCILFQQVTLGVNGGGGGAPRLGGHVRVGPGARVIGPVAVGDNAVIGANSVVLRDVPAGAVVVGVPARILRNEGEA